jgi:hypothetical protein
VLRSAPPSFFPPGAISPPNETYSTRASSTPEAGRAARATCMRSRRPEKARVRKTFICKRVVVAPACCFLCSRWAGGRDCKPGHLTPGLVGVNSTRPGDHRSRRPCCTLLTALGRSFPVAVVTKTSCTRYPFVAFRARGWPSAEKKVVLVWNPDSESERMKRARSSGSLY